MKPTPIDKKMFEAIKLLKDRGELRFRQEFCDAIELDKQNIRNIKMGIQHFRPEHIKKACKKYNINANWVFGLSDVFSRVQAEIHFISEAKTSNKKVNKDTRKKAK